MGKNAGKAVISETKNTFVGANSGINNTGSGNTIVGYSTMVAGTNCSYNCGYGNGSLHSCTTGDVSACYGLNLGQNITSGGNNICIGYLSRTTGGAVDSAYNITTESNHCVIGNNNMTNYYFSGASTSAIDCNSTTLSLFTTPTTVNLGDSGSTITASGTIKCDDYDANTTNGTLSIGNNFASGAVLQLGNSNCRMTSLANSFHL